MIQPVRIAMWSGPRNISTAMMRAWGNRPDTFVIDEPFYAYYLRATGKQHPGADEIIASSEHRLGECCRATDRPDSESQADFLPKTNGRIIFCRKWSANGSAQSRIAFLFATPAR